MFIHKHTRTHLLAMIIHSEFKILGSYCVIIKQYYWMFRSSLCKCATTMELLIHIVGSRLPILIILVSVNILMN